MKSKVSRPRVIAKWSGISRMIRTAIRGLDQSELDLRDGADGWSIREYVHHLVESNLIASGMLLVALATDAGYYDWTWVNPDKRWMRRMGYDNAAVDPAIKLLAAQAKHFGGLFAAHPESISRLVTLKDAPDAELYTRTIEQVLTHEVDHAKGHLAEVRRIREAHAR